MSKDNQYLDDISQIRNMMEQSSRFISLSGLSGIFAGVYALIGAAVAYVFIEENRALSDPLHIREMVLLIDAACVFILAIGTGIYFTTRKAKKQGLKTWDSSSKRLIINLLIPLAAGGIFCISLITRGYGVLIVPATLIFYGLALINASKYTFRDIRFLGFAEVGLGLLASFVVGNGLLIWAIGFGLLHIVYGTIMYIKYEK